MQLDLFDQSTNKIFGAKTYEEFRTAFLEYGCTKCRLSKSRTHLVLDRGNPQARVVLIGEGPGADEDARGQAFVGRAGQLMDALFRAIGIDTNRQMLILNVIKCRPPENRQPMADEAETCLPYLRKQLELVQPKLIVLLGATAVKHALGRRDLESMESVVGQFFTDPRFPGAVLVILYHPAFILRDPRKQPIFERHLRELKAYASRERLLV